MGWWACPSLIHLVSGLPLLFLATTAPEEWYDLLRVENSAFTLLNSPCRFFTTVLSASLSTSLVVRRLVFNITCSGNVEFSVVRLVMAAQSSTVACARLENSYCISIVLFAPPPLLYPPWWEVFWILRRSACVLGCIFQRNSVYSRTFLSYPAELRFPISREKRKVMKRNAKGMCIYQCYI